MIDLDAFLTRSNSMVAKQTKQNIKKHNKTLKNLRKNIKKCLKNERKNIKKCLKNDKYSKKKNKSFRNEMKHAWCVAAVGDA